jgi:hypothetical protein
MSPREVKSLNDLAMAHGGQLSINPQTGLPEAGFLSSILPMVAGAALMAAGVPAGYAALGVGAGATLLTGSLEKGLMAGLGAYGGANLGQGLLASGTDAAVAAAPEVAAAQQNAAIQMDKFYNPTSQVLDKGGMEAIQKASMDASAAQTAARTAAAPDFMGKIQAMGKGIGSLGQEGGLSSLYQNLGGSPMSLLKSVGSAAAPAIGEAMKPKPIEEEKSDADMGQRYGFSMNPTSGQQQVQPGQDPLANTQSSTTTPFPTPDIYGREQRYFAPSYTKLTPEQAKSMYGYAEGGTTQANPQPATEPFPIPRFTNEGKQPSGETPALQAFRQMQAQRAQPQAAYTGGSTPATGGPPLAKSDLAPTTVEGLYRTYLDRAPEQGGLDFWNKHFGSSVDADEVARFKHATIPELAANKRLAESTGGTLAREFNNYQRETVGEPNQLKAPTTPTTTGDGFLSSLGLAENPLDYSNLSESERNRPGLFGPGSAGQNSDSELIYDPIKQTYTKNPNFAAPAAEPAADAFNVENRPVIGYDRNGQKIYGEKKMGPYGGMGSFRAAGGLLDAYAGGGMPTTPNSIGDNAHYPQAHTLTNRFSAPTQMPISEDVVLAAGGISHLGDYSDGGRLLRGPGDGVSDSIPAMIGKKQPARLADGEFVVPARIVSELGNGSTEAGARKLYAMMDRIQKARGKTVGKGKVAKNSRSEKYLPA